jgi:hypothetical protein
VLCASAAKGASSSANTQDKEDKQGKKRRRSMANFEKRSADSDVKNAPLDFLPGGEK